MSCTRADSVITSRACGSWTFWKTTAQGLNLTWEVRDGIVNHSKTRVIEIMGENWGQADTLEGEVCKIADIVAYINHDIDDAIRADIISGK